MTVANGNDLNRDANGNPSSNIGIVGSSSRGPTDDGRIKPDITGNGNGLTSTKGTGTGTSRKTGTSMASPNVAGSSILLQDYFSKRFPGHLMRANTLKNLILHTADEAGAVGPDYRYGWGYMNTLRGAELIDAYADNPGNQRMLEAILEDGETHTYTYEWDGVSPIRVTLFWEDAPPTFVTSSNDDRTPDLLNDLDVRVSAPSTTQHLPWAMPFVINGFDSDDFTTPATRADNTTDNTEQVLIDTPSEVGIYTVSITHKGSLIDSSGGAVSGQRYSLMVSGVVNAVAAAVPVITGFTPSEGTHHHTLMTVSGSDFLLGANVSLQAPGLETVDGYAEVVTPDQIEVFLPLDRVPAGDYTVVVTNPDGQSGSSSGVFTVTPYTDLLNEDFDAPGFDFVSAGWTTAADTGTNDWVVSTTRAVSGSSAHVPTGTNEVLSYLESPPIVVPSTSDPIKLSFQHKWDFEIELAELWYSSHDAEDAALLQVSVDGGPFEDVGQDYWNDSHAPGVEIVSGPYWDNLDSSNPLESTSGTTYGWTDESGGWQRTTVMLDAADYANKTVRFRWVLGTQNTGSDSVKGWWIDNISPSVKSDNTIPQVTSVPSDQATVGQPYTETIAFTDADGNPMTLSAPTKPAWLGFTDNTDGTGSFSGSPGAGDVGTVDVTIEANDGTGTRSYTFTLIVLPSGGNTLPSFTTVSLPDAFVNESYSTTVQATDADGHSLSLFASVLPSWLVFEDNGDGTASLSGTPTVYTVGTGDVTIVTNDGVDDSTANLSVTVRPRSVVGLTSTSISVTEGTPTATFTVSRTVEDAGVVTIDYATSNGSAQAPSDYTATSGTLTWADGESGDKTIQVPITDDTIRELEKTFNLTLSDLTGIADSGSLSGIAEIVDDDVPSGELVGQGTLYLLEHGSLAENAGVYTLTRTDDNIFQGVVANFSAQELVETGDYVEVSFRIRANSSNNQDRQVSWGFFSGSPVTGDGQRGITDTWEGYGHQVGTRNSSATKKGGAFRQGAGTVSLMDHVGGGKVVDGAFAEPSFSTINQSSTVQVHVRIQKVNATQLRLVSTYATPHSNNSNSGSNSGISWSYSTVSGTCTFTGIFNLADGPTEFNGFAIASRGNNWVLQDVEVRSNVGISLVPEAPAITRQPGSQSLVWGTNTILSVAASGSHPMTYQWKRDGSDLPGATTNFLELNSVTDVDAGDYTVVVSNGVSSITSAAAVVQVSPATPPSFTQQPSGGTVDEGGSIVLAVAADGFPAPTYQWRRDGVNLVDGVGISGATTSSLTLDPVTTGMAGFYDCVATNGGGSVPSNFVSIAVNAAPSIALVWPVGDTAAIPSGVGLALDTTVTDDGGTPTLLWEKVSGPGNVTWDQTDQADTGATFSADGEYVLRLTAQDGSLATVQEWTVTVGATGGRTTGFQESGGQVVIEAENYDQMSAGTGGFAGTSWSDVTSPSGFSGAGALLLPNTGSSLNARDTIIGPRLDYTVSFQETGTYRVWVRMLGANGNDDSVHAGLDGTLLSAGGVGMSNSNGNWAWVNSASGVVTFSIPTAGEYTFNIWPREDGVMIDKVVLTKSTSFTPSGTGPAESPQGVGNVGPLVDAGSLADGQTGQTSTLAGTASDDGLPSTPGVLTLQWQAFSGPGTVVFGDAGQIDSTATADAAGSYTLRLYGDDGEVKTFDDVSWTVTGGAPDPAEQWRSTVFAGDPAYIPGVTGNTGVFADTYDYDGDGQVNLMERAFGTSPTDPLDHESPSQTIVDHGGTDYFSIEYPRLTGGTGTTGVNYTVAGIVYCVQVSSTPDSGWNDGPTYVEAVGQPVDHGDGTETVTVRTEAAMSGQDKVFLRVRIETP